MLINLCENSNGRPPAIGFMFLLIAVGSIKSDELQISFKYQNLWVATQGMFTI